ncbi:MAG: Alpha/beta hydrolase protein [Pedosphaera sp.]|nr:Alpha/beta hydrolase protein [Pedosphaera sp.]
MRPFLAAVLLSLLVISPAWSQTNADFTRTEDVVYGRKFGTALTLDVFQPKTPNGIGIIFVVSGGWFSAHENINIAACQPFLRRGYTVFTVVHGSQPRFIIPEIMQDMHRSIRFIRHNAAKYGVDPQRLGVTGGSAGGHLSLILGTGTGSETKANAKDPINRESSAVQCVACFFPPTDFLNYGGPGLQGSGTGTLNDYRPAFGPMADTEEGRQKLGHQISPIYFVTSNLPPTLIIHGDADTLVPIQQSESFMQKAKEAGAEVKLVVKAGAKHGWDGWLSTDLETCADWFDAHLRGIKAPAETK